GLLSEHRALSSFVRERIRRGHGPVKIRFDARHRGFDADAVELTMAAQEIDWIEAASDVLSRRFGGREAASSVDNIVDGLEGNEKEETLVSGNERRQIEIDQQKASRKEQARRYRFLTQRGFTGEQISEAMRSH
ncbi:MAG: RecX family transcriptional regulator, partial [Pseudomonadales bacterium]|nr:RecX family transcriptional regulator [Pseudomonadales bacterium]